MQAHGPSGPDPRQPNPEPDLPTPPGEPDPADGVPGDGEGEHDGRRQPPLRVRQGSPICAVWRLDISALCSACNSSLGAVGLASRTNSPGVMSAL